MSSNNQENRIAGAIEYPATSRNVQPVPEQPRQPRNLQGLLRFAMEATKAEDAPGPSELGPMDEERRKFLQEAMNAITVNIAERLQNAIKVLSDLSVMDELTDEPVPQHIHVHLATVLDLVDDIDVANDFSKLGGFAIFPVCFASKNTNVRGVAGSVLGTMCQNNPPCQEKALNYRLLSLLISLVYQEAPMGTPALAKYLFGVSGMIRGFKPGMRVFLEEGGCEMLLEVLNCSDNFAKARAAFLVQHTSSNPEVKEHFIQLNILQVILDQLSYDELAETQLPENLLSLLDSLMSECPTSLRRQLVDKEKTIKEKIQRHLGMVESEDSRYAEADHCISILKQLELLKNYDDASEEVDR